MSWRGRRRRGSGEGQWEWSESWVGGGIGMGWSLGRRPLGGFSYVQEGGSLDDHLALVPWGCACLDTRSGKAAGRW